MTKMFENANAAKQFIFSGNAIFTVVSKKTGSRFTFRMIRPRSSKSKNDYGFRFVQLLTGPDNTRSYSFMGTVSSNGVYIHSGNSKMTESAKAVQAYIWMLKWVMIGDLRLDQMEIWHEGRCGKCGKKLTVPSSIENGLGPECVKTVYRCN